MTPYYPATQMGQQRWSPAPQRYMAGTPARMGQSYFGLGVTAAGLIGLALSSAVAYVGIRTGSKEKGFGSVVGWVVGVMGVISGLGTLAGLAGVALLAPVVDEA